MSLGSIAPPSGSLGGTSLAELFASFADRRARGSITLRDAEGNPHVVVFLDGAPAKLATAFPVPDLGMVLVGLKLVDESVYAATHDPSLDERAFGDALVEEGTITEGQRRAAVIEQRLRTIATLFRRLGPATTFEISERDVLAGDELAARSSIAIDPIAALYRGVRAASKEPRMQGAVAALGGARLVLHHAAPLERFRFAPADRQVLARLQMGPQRVSDLRQSALLAEDDLRALVHVLVLTRAVSTEGRLFDPMGADPVLLAAPLARTQTRAPGLPIGPQLPDHPLVKSALGRNAYLFFGFALVPLFASLFAADVDIKERIERTLRHHPELSSIAERPDATLDELLAALPGHRFEGAFLGRDTWLHWLFAIASASIFLALVGALFDRGSAKAWSLPKVAFFTSTAGILLLLGVQKISLVTEGLWFNGGGVLMLFLVVVKFIGFSYRAALDPSNGFVLSFFGFTFGVGLCEEMTKAVPIFWHFRKVATLDFRGAAVWGLASGVGFGVAEGIMYSSDYYNGVHGYDVYVMRFVSCVALHAVWSAAVSIRLYERQRDVQGHRHWAEVLFSALRIVFVPMMLHGLYDTLLKKDQRLLALVIAVASFAWLIWRVERARHRDAEAMPLSAL